MVRDGWVGEKPKLPCAHHCDFGFILHPPKRGVCADWALRL